MKKSKKEAQGPLKRRVLKGKERAKVVGKLKAAIKAGRVEIGNAAAKTDTGSGSVKCWMANDAFGVEYSLPGFGFGGFTFKVTECEPPACSVVLIAESPSGRLHCVDSEMMSRKFVKEVLCRLVDEAKWDHDETPASTMRNPLE